MGATDVLRRLTALGVLVTARPNGNLWLEPASKIPPDLLEMVRKHKTGVVAALHQEENLVAQAHNELLRWARDLARREEVLESPVQFLESPSVPVAVTNVGAYASRHLAIIAFGRTGPRFGTYDDLWYTARTRAALAALGTLRIAMG